MTQAHSFRPTPLALAVGTALSLSGTPALAADRAGRVLTSVGPVVARTEDGSARSLARGDRIYAGDVILTNRGRVQIRFRDGALVSLDPRTKFEVERYDTGEDDPDEGGSAIMNLFRGALRTITGAIGDETEDTYRMNTPVATVGVRGTQYALALCSAGSCGSGVPDGLYGHVVEDGVAVDNSAGSGSFPSGAYFRVPDGDTPPQRILRPPGDVFRGEAPPEDDDGGGDIEGPDGGGGGDDDETTDDTTAFEGDDDTLTGEFSESTETGTEAEDEVTQDQTGPSFTTLTNAGFAGAIVGDDQSGNPFTDGGACISDAQCPTEVDDNGNVRLVDLSTQTVDATDAGLTLVESGTVPSLDATWGRWDGDIVVDNGTTQQTITGSFAWAYSQNPTTTSELSSAFSPTGTLNYNFVGGPSPVGTINGTAWSVSTLSVSLDIGGGTATIQGGTGLQNVNLNLTGPASIDIENDINSATIDPASGDRGFIINLADSFSPDTGTVEAVFAGDNADGLVLEFEATDDSTGEVVEGVKILSQ